MSITILSKAAIAAALICLAASAEAQQASRPIKPPAGKTFVNSKGEPMQCKRWRHVGSYISRSGCATEQEWKEAGY